MRSFWSIVFALLFVTACNGSGESLTDTIPSDASYVVHVNMQSLIEKSQYDLFKNSTVQQGINMLKVHLKDEDKIKVVDDFLKDANSLGVNLKNDFYFYMNSSVYGFTIGVNNNNLLKDNLIKLTGLPESQISKDGDVYEISPDPQMCFAWDNSRLVCIFVIPSLNGVVGEETKPLNSKEFAKELLSQGSDKSINSNKAFADFVLKEKDISAFYSMSELAELPAFSSLNTMRYMGKEDAESMETFKRALSEFKGISLGIYTSFEKGEIKVNSEYYYDTPETEKKFREYAAKVSGTIVGEQLKYITPSPVFMASMNLKGDGLYEALADFGVVNMINKQLPDTIQLDRIKEINGDVSFALTSIKNNKDAEGTGTMPQLLLFADVKDGKSVLDFVKGLIEVDYKELSPSSYVISDKDMNVYFGVQGNTFYVTNIESLPSQIGSAGTNSGYADLIKGKTSLVAGDIRPLKSFIESRAGVQILPFIGLLDELGEYRMTSSQDKLTSEGSLEFVNKDKNSLNVLCLQIDNIITQLSTMMTGY
jgi:hypothetical protein